MIIGEAGIGKTALAEQLAAEAADDGATVLRARCYEAERSLFLQPVVEAVAPAVSRMPAAALRDLLGEHAAAAAALLPEAAALLGPPPSWRGSPDMERRRSFQAMTALLTGLAAHGPALLFVDDLQYAGQATVEFIHYLARHVRGSRLLTVVTVRAEHDTDVASALDPVATRVEVGPLGAAAVEQLARAAGHGGLAGPILQRTRGHTLFVVEVLRALAGGDTGVPGSLRSAVQARVRRTGAGAETLLRAASVLGSAVDPAVLGDLLDLGTATALELCETALEARLLVVSGRDYEFANDLIREVMYASTPGRPGWPTTAGRPICSPGSRSRWPGIPRPPATGPGRRGPGCSRPRTRCAGTRSATRARWPRRPSMRPGAPGTPRWERARSSCAGGRGRRPVRTTARWPT